MLNKSRIPWAVQNKTPWYSIKAATDQESADVMIYQYIGFGGVTAEQFATELNALNVSTINLRMNTPGGDVFDGLAIYNSLKKHKAAVHVMVDGIAASIGSVIAMAGDTITMGQSSFMMIHSPWAMVIGNAKDMREMADTLDKIGGSLANVYTTRKGVTTEQAMAWMADETWITAEEAVAAGLADSVAEEGADAQNKLDLSGYKNVPAALQGVTESSKDVGQAQRALMRKRLQLVQRDERSR